MEYAVTSSNCRVMDPTYETILSFKRRDLLKDLPCPCFIPVSDEFLLVERRPFDHKPCDTGWQATREDREVVNINQRNVSAVFRVEMWRIVVIEEHLNDDAKESTDLRHVKTRDATRGKRPQAFCLLP